MEEPNAQGFMPRSHPQSGHPWASRDYADIDCKAVSCIYNALCKCGVPSRAKIGDDGRCEGFVARPDTPPEKRDGD